MALQDELVTLNFGQGMDTKSDPKLVIPTKFQLIQNGLFTKAKRVSKRNGYDVLTASIVGGGSLGSPQMVKSYRNEITCAASGSNGLRLYSYSSTLAGWEDRGKYTSIAVSKQIINAPTFAPASGALPSNSYGTANCSSVISGNIALYVFDGAGAIYGYKNSVSVGSGTGTTATYITVVDQNTGTHLCDELQITNGLGFSKAAILGTNTFAVFYISSSATNRLAVRVITVTLGGGVVVGSEVTIGTCAALSDTTAQFPYAYDFVTTSTGAIVAAANEPNIGLFKIDTTGTTTASATINSTGNITPITTLLDGSGNIWVYWGSASSNLKYAIYSSSLASVLAVTAIATVATIGGIQPTLQQLAAVSTSSTAQTIYYSTYYIPTDTVSAIYSTIRSVSVTLTGTIGSVSVFLQNMDIYGKIFTVSGVNYMPGMSLSPTAPTGFLIDLADALPVAKFLPLEAEGTYVQGYGISGTSGVTPVLRGMRYPSFINSAQALSSTQYSFAASFLISLLPVSNTSSTNLSAYPQIVTSNIILGFAGMTFDFAHTDAYQSVIQQDTMVLNGGVVSMYDGAQVSELGFSINPDNISAKTSASGGSIASGTYVYYVTYEWIDAMGNLYESAPSPPITLFLNTGSTNSITFRIPTLNLTQKTTVTVKLWRADSGTSGTIANLIAVASNAAASAGFPYLNIQDTQVTTTNFNGTLYTEGGSILDNIAAPPSMILWTNNNRIWCVDGENPETTLEFSKTASLGTGISFSTGLLEYRIDSKNGSITGVSPMDEKTVVMKQNGAGYFIGDGPNDSGTGSTLSNFQFIPSDVGCTNSKSVVLYPDGILFRTLKGIYKISRGLQIGYFGFEVESYNSQDILSALIVSNKNQIRFLTSSGSSLLYDYVFSQWSVFTNHTGYSADIWNGTYVYVRTDGSIYEENSTSFLDNATSYALALQTAWITFNGVQNFERVKQLFLLGDYANGSSASHGFQIQAAYDFSPTFGSAMTYLFGAASSSGVFQFRDFLRRQKCDAISLLITEVTNSVSGESVDLTNMSFMAGLKKGANKLPVGQSIG